MHLVSMITGIFMLLCSAAVFADAEQEGSKAAEEWLVMVDSGAYGESWDESSSLFQSNVPREDWVLALERVHTPLGAILSREMKDTEFTTTQPGVPDGEYVVIRFNTSFEKKQAAIETVTVMKDEDGTWRAAGYFIQ